MALAPPNRIRRLSIEKTQIAYANQDLSGSARLIPLNLAIQNGVERIVKSLVAKGADVNGPGCPLKLALHGGNIEIAYFLYQHGAKYDHDNFTNMPSLTPLHLICEHGQTTKEISCKFAEELIVKEGANIHAIAVDTKLGMFNNHNPLSIALSKGFAEIVWILISLGGKEYPFYDDKKIKGGQKDKEGYSKVIVEALINTWSPKNHFKFPLVVRESIVSFLLVAKRLQLPFDKQIILKICSFVAYGWLNKNFEL